MGMQQKGGHQENLKRVFLYSWQIQLLETMKFDLDFQEMEVPNGDSNAAKKLWMGELVSYNLTTSCEVLSLSPSGGWLEQRHETLLQMFLLFLLIAEMDMTALEGRHGLVNCDAFSTLCSYDTI